MLKLKKTHYLLLLISSLLLSILYLNVFLNFSVKGLNLSPAITGSLNKIPTATMPISHVIAITVAVVGVVYLIITWNYSKKLN